MGTLGTMFDKESWVLHILETEFTNEQCLGLGVRCRKGRVIPSFNFVLSHAYLGNVFYLGNFMMLWCSKTNLYPKVSIEKANASVIIDV